MASQAPSARRTAAAAPGAKAGAPHARRLALTGPVLAVAVAAPLGALYLTLAPAAGDLAAATYRSDLFARVGFSTWDTGWYAAHGYWLPSYSLLSPALGTLLGVRLLLALSAVTAAVLFALIAERVFPRSAARAATVAFALGVSVGMLSGRVPFDLGAAIGLAGVLALLRGRLAIALVLAALCAAASPVAGAFLALVGLAGAAGASSTAREARTQADRTRADRTRAKATSTSDDGGGGPRAAAARDGLALAAGALAPVLVLSLAYPGGGYEPFAASAFWPALAAVLAFAALLPRGPLCERHWRALRIGAGLYALALIGAYALRTPMGGNAARLGPLLAAPLLAGVLWEGSDPALPSRFSGPPYRARPRRSRLLLLALAPVLLYWQLATPVKDYVAIAGDPSLRASYYAPLLAELEALDRGAPAIVEVPMTKAHWEAAYLPWHGGVRLARGWERQLDTRYGALFYGPTLTPGAYRSWLAANRVRYVALPDAPLDAAGAKEGALVAAGLPYLRELWHSRHWRLYGFAP